MRSDWYSPPICEEDFSNLLWGQNGSGGNVKRAENQTVGGDVTTCSLSRENRHISSSCHQATSCLCPTRRITSRLSGWGTFQEEDEDSKSLRDVPVSLVGWSDRIISNRKLYFAVAHVQTIDLFSWLFETSPTFVDTSIDGTHHLWVRWDTLIIGEKKIFTKKEDWVGQWTWTFGFSIIKISAKEIPKDKKARTCYEVARDLFPPRVLARLEYFPPITVTTMATIETWLVDHSASHSSHLSAF